MPITGDQLLAAQGNYEPQRQNNVRVMFNVPALGQSLAGTEIWLALKSMPYPTEANSRKILRWFNESRFYAGSVEDFGTMQIRFRDFIDIDIARRLLAWRRLVWDPETASVGLARNYKGSGMLYLLPPGNNAPNPGIDLSSPAQYSRRVQLQGCWPVSFDMGEFSTENDGEQVEITLEVSIDRAFPSDGQGPSLEGMKPVF